MRCPTCQTEMKPMLLSWYCPRECDRPKAPEFVSPRTQWLVGPAPTYRKTADDVFTLANVTYPAFDMFVHVWVPCSSFRQDGVRVTLVPHEKMYVHPTVTDSKPFAVCLYGIDGRTIAWQVPGNGFLQGKVVWCVGPYSVSP